MDEYSEGKDPVQDNGTGWEKEFREHGRIWGEEPGILGRSALAYFREHSVCNKGLHLIDLGCGYGRDAIFIARNCKITITGLDSSPAAIESAIAGTPEPEQDTVHFRCVDILTPPEGLDGDIVYAANVYQILRENERAVFRETIRKLLKHQGLLFLSTLSIHDPEHQGRGVAIAGEPYSLVEPGTGKYLHLCSENELNKDFGFLTIQELYELEYIEPRAGGDHHHISWVLIAGNE